MGSISISVLSNCNRISLTPLQFFCLTLFSCAASFLAAQPDTSRILQAVDITSNRDSVKRISILNSTVPHYHLTQDDLRESGITDAGSAMRFVPGVQLKDYGGAGGMRTVSFRSLGSSHTGVVIDGFKIPSAQIGSVNLSGFDVFGIDEMRFSTGQVESIESPTSAYLNSSVIEIRSKLLNRPEKMETEIYSSASSIQFFEEGVLARFPIGKKAFAGVQAIMRFGEGEYSFVYAPWGTDSVMRREHSGMQSYRVKMIAGFDGERSKTRLNISYFNSKQQLPGAIILYNPASDQWLFSDEKRMGVYHIHQLKKVVLKINGFVQSSQTQYDDFNFLNAQGFIESDYDFSVAGSGLMADIPLLKNKALFVVGTDGIYSHLISLSLTGQPARLESNSLVAFKYFLKRLKIESNVTLQLMSDNNGELTRKFAELSPFASVLWTPFKGERWRFRSFYKRTFTLPTMNDLYFHLIGNVDLEPERAHISNVGISWSREFRNCWFEFSADAFVNQVTNKIVAIPTKDLFTWSMQNIGEVFATGSDVSMLVGLSVKRWRFILTSSYSYNQSSDKTTLSSPTYNQQIPYVPYHTGNTALSIYWRKWFVQQSLFYTGLRYSLNENNYANYLPDFYDIGISMGSNLTVGESLDLKFVLSCHNLLNKNYEIIRSFPMPGRNYQITLNLNFG